MMTMLARPRQQALLPVGAAAVELLQAQHVEVGQHVMINNSYQLLSYNTY